VVYWLGWAGVCELRWTNNRLQDLIGSYLAFVRAQPHLSSAYNAYGRGSLEKDVQEIENVVEFFKKSRGPSPS
jgi:hypothetical protein